MTQIGMRITGALFAVVLVAGIATATAWATGAFAETQVRISARQLDDGRVEFALQQNDGSGWGERELATNRYFPAEVGHGRWLNSSPYAVAVGEPQAAEVPVEPATTRSAGPYDLCGDVEAALRSGGLHVVFDADRTSPLGPDDLLVILSNAGSQWGLPADLHSIGDNDGDGIVCEALFN